MKARPLNLDGIILGPIARLAEMKENGCVTTLVNAASGDLMQCRSSPGYGYNCLVWLGNGP